MYWTACLGDTEWPVTSFVTDKHAIALNLPLKIAPTLPSGLPQKEYPCVCTAWLNSHSFTVDLEQLAGFGASIDRVSRTPRLSGGYKHQSYLLISFSNGVSQHALPAALKIAFPLSRLSVSDKALLRFDTSTYGQVFPPQTDPNNHHPLSQQAL